MSRRLSVLAIGLVLLLCSCSAPEAGSSDDRRDGFYAGVSGGLSSMK
jgi:hypothetical protein